jgi:2'-hydroxyisoflavone reductase
MSIQNTFAEEKVEPLRILILGGTGFTGPFQVKYALSRGHKVTVFNRGKTHPGELPKEVEQLTGDRNGQLEALKGKQWDVCIDNPTTLPAWVRDAAQILKGNVERYIFISTISVYADTNTGPDENTTLAKYEGADPYKETLEAMKASGYKTYGPLKALSEQETEKWFPGKSLIIRPGLIVGPRDETDRFTYWPVRTDRGGEVLAPGNPSDPVQFIDGRDLAAWTIRMAENKTFGIYNATGPNPPMTMGQMLEGIADLSGLGRTQPGLALALGIFMFALAGIPPTAGFFGKLYVFLAAIDAHLVGLAVIGVVTSVVGAFYYLRVVKVMYFDEPVASFDRPIAAELKWVVVIAAGLTMFFILLPDPIVGGAEAAAKSLFAR